MSDELEDQIEMELSYGDSKSEWIRHAIKLRMHVDPLLDDLYESYENEKRIEFVEWAVKEKVDEVKQEANGGHEDLVGDNS